MQREIKFRAWDASRKQFARGGLMMTIEGQISVYPITAREDYVLQQFTGLKDKNGREIYEGDIVKCVSQNFDEPLVFAVEPTEGGTYCFPDDMGADYIPLLENADDIDCEIEVIGNIYENPELL